MFTTISRRLLWLKKTDINSWNMDISNYYAVNNIKIDSVNVTVTAFPR